MSTEPEEPQRTPIRIPTAALLVVLAMLAVFALLYFRARGAAPRTDGKAGRASVSIYDDGRPAEGRWVVFHGADGTVVASMKSGADGKASAEIRAGGMITVAYGTSVHQLLTVVSVQPGDEILVGEREDEGGAGNTIATAKVKLPGAYPQATRYVATLGVGTTDLPDVAAALPMPILRRFVVDQRRFPVLGLAMSERGEELAYTFDWGTLSAHDGGDSEVHLPAWSTDWREHRIDVANAPPGLTRITSELAILSGDDRFDRGRREAAIGSIDAGAPTLRFLVPRPLGAAAAYRVELVYGASGDKVLLTRRVKSMPADVHLDLRPLLLPRVSGAAVEVGHDRARPVVRWRSEGGGTRQADVTVVQLWWPDTREHVWTVVAPPTAPPRFDVPELPAVLAEWRPDGRPIHAAVALVEASFYEGYDDVRKKGIQLAFEPPENDEPAVQLSVTGDLVF